MVYPRRRYEPDGADTITERLQEEIPNLPSGQRA